MFTPQDIEKISFGTATFGGYVKDDVDEVLEPLVEDYITLYKENALLKSKMRVLVSKLEEYRQNEASMKDALVNAQKTCDKMVREAEEKCKLMLNNANAAAAENAKNTTVLIAEENERVEEARRLAAAKIEELQAQLNNCVQALERIKEANRPAPKPAAASGVYDYDSEPDNPVPPVDPADAVADEISHNVEAIVGTTEQVHPNPEPKPAANSSTTSRFGNTPLKFGRNYDPTKKRDNDEEDENK
ncbi:MAG: DivIVA domain-containing protein [Ruminococcaceae bacterium]|nr:DivIVA domain-containing protein [Oscillospiraceae bacterium]